MATHESHRATIRDWLGKSIDSDALLAALTGHFNADVDCIARRSNVDRETIQRAIVAAMNVVRGGSSINTLFSCSGIVNAVVKVLLTQMPELGLSFEAYRLERTERRRRNQRKKNRTKSSINFDQLQQWALSVTERRNGRAGGPAQARFDLPRELPEIERSGISFSAEDFAALVDATSREAYPLLRLLALRVIGGWSLREIAKRDASSIDAVVDAWVRARDLITVTTPRVASVVTFDLFDLHLLTASLRDRTLRTTISWRAFEKILAATLDRFGYVIELQRGTKDGGIDILAVRRDDIFGSHRYIVQAKRWNKPVGVEPVRELLFLRQHYGATKACLATTSSFTSGAWQLGNEYQWCLELRDYERLQEWLALAFPDRGLV